MPFGESRPLLGGGVERLCAVLHSRTAAAPYRSGELDRKPGDRGSRGRHAGAKPGRAIAAARLPEKSIGTINFGCPVAGGEERAPRRVDPSSARRRAPQELVCPKADQDSFQPGLLELP